MSGQGGRSSLAGVALLVMASCGGLPEQVLEDGRQRQLEAAGVGAFDTTGTFELAGVSTHRRIELEPLNVRRLNGDTVGPAYAAFHSRCSACHAAPAPDSKPAYMWSGVMKRMSQNQLDAGLMPIRPGDEAIVLDFLERHAEDRR